MISPRNNQSCFVGGDERFVIGRHESFISPTHVAWYMLQVTNSYSFLVKMPCNFPLAMSSNKICNVIPS